MKADRQTVFSVDRGLTQGQALDKVSGRLTAILAHGGWTLAKNDFAINATFRAGRITRRVIERPRAGRARASLAMHCVGRIACAC